MSQRTTVGARDEPRAQELEIAQRQTLPPVCRKRVIVKFGLDLATDQDTTWVARLGHAQIRFEKDGRSYRLVALCSKRELNRLLRRKHTTSFAPAGDPPVKRI